MREQGVALLQPTSALPAIEGIKRIAQEHKATLVLYSIIDGAIPLQGEGKSQESEPFIGVIPPSGEVAFRRVDLKVLRQQQNTSLSNLIISTREAIGCRRAGTVPQVVGLTQLSQAIAQLLNTQGLTGAAATKKDILQKMPRARIIHLATQAIVDNERGIGSASAVVHNSSLIGCLHRSKPTAIRKPSSDS